MAFLEIKNLSHRFPDGTPALRSIDFSIDRGDFVVIAGVNGSGKTTLLRHINGLLMPTEGTVMLDGVAVADDPIRVRQRVGMVFQDADTQIVGETVADDVAFGPENLSLPRETIRRRVADALSAVGLSDLAGQRPHVLSGGEKRRLAIAGVLAMHPEVILFDEPFSNLDYPGVRQVLGQMLDLHQKGCTLIVTTHDLEKVVAHADRLFLMHAGKIVRTGPPRSLLEETEAFGIRRPCAVRFGREIESWLI